MRNIKRILLYANRFTLFVSDRWIFAAAEKYVREETNKKYNNNIKCVIVCLRKYANDIKWKPFLGICCHVMKSYYYLLLFLSLSWKSYFGEIFLFFPRLLFRISKTNTLIFVKKINDLVYLNNVSSFWFIRTRTHSR